MNRTKRPNNTSQVDTGGGDYITGNQEIYGPHVRGTLIQGDQYTYYLSSETPVLSKEDIQATQAHLATMPTDKLPAVKS